jgi:hypothetical protein
MIKVIPDQNCPVGVAYLLQMDTWTLRSIGEVPRIIDIDGQKVRAESGSDSFTVRVGFYGNLSCSAPGYNVRIALA